MLKTWQVDIDGVTHTISYKKGVLKTVKIIDGVETPVKSKNWALQMIDEPIALGSKVLNLTAIGNKVDLAVDGVYLDSKQPYVPLNNVPAWVNAMPIALLVIGWFFCGIIGIAIGIIASMLIITSSISTTLKKPIRRCIIITVVAIILQVALGIVVNGTLWGLW